MGDLNPLLKPTVLQRICTELQTRLKGMTGHDDLPLWNTIAQGTIGTASNMTFPSVSLEQGPEETVARLFPFEDKIVTLYVEFKFNPLLDLDSYDTFRYYLGKLQQRLFGGADNRTLGGLATNVVEVTSNPEIESGVDPSPGGLLTFQVHYRIVQGDPYHLPSEMQNYG